MAEDESERAALWAYALRYLARYASSRANLAAVLERRLARLRDAADPHEEVTKPDRMIAGLVERAVDLGYIDDAEYARSKVRRLVEKGRAPVAVRSALVARGVEAELIEEAMRDAFEDCETTAALAFARRKRLGPWRRGSLDEDAKRRELGRFARAGFSYRVARAIMDRE